MMFPLSSFDLKSFSICTRIILELPACLFVGGVLASGEQSLERLVYSLWSSLRSAKATSGVDFKCGSDHNMDEPRSAWISMDLTIEVWRLSHRQRFSWVIMSWSACQDLERNFLEPLHSKWHPCWVVLYHKLQCISIEVADSVAFESYGLLESRSTSWRMFWCLLPNLQICELEGVVVMEISALHQWKMSICSFGHLFWLTRIEVVGCERLATDRVIEFIF